MKRIAFITVLIFTFCLALYSQTNEVTCPRISLITPHTVLIPNSPVIFTAEVNENVKKLALRYEWSFSSGKILEGQGTSKIKFVIENQENTNIHILLKVIGLPEKCSGVSEDIIGVLPPIFEDPYDEFEKLSPNDLKARLDALISKVENDPKSTGLILITFNKKDSRNYKIT